jgi:hypothetical protein
MVSFKVYPEKCATGWIVCVNNLMDPSEVLRLLGIALSYCERSGTKQRLYIKGDHPIVKVMLDHYFKPPAEYMDVKQRSVHSQLSKSIENVRIVEEPTYVRRPVPVQQQRWDLLRTPDRVKDQRERQRRLYR